MTVPDPLFAYLAVLSVIQPGRVQDVERFAPEVLPDEPLQRGFVRGLSWWIATGSLGPKPTITGH